MKKVTAISTLAAAGLFSLLASPAFAQVSPTPVQHYNKAVINWASQPNTRCYRIYYKETNASSWQHSIRCKDLPATSYSYTVQYLKPNTTYTYEVKAVNNVNRQQETSLGVKQMVTSPMTW